MGERSWRIISRPYAKLRAAVLPHCNQTGQHAKYMTFQLSEVAVSRELFAAILDRIQQFGVPPPLVPRG